MKKNTSYPAFTGANRWGSRHLNRKLRREVIAAYLRTLETVSDPIGLEPRLPYPKEEIRQAIIEELAENPTGDSRPYLEIAYVQLETFLPWEEYRIVIDFKNESNLAQKMADMGDPTSILRSVGMVDREKGEQAIRIQESISRKMRERQIQIREIGSFCFSLNPSLDSHGHACS